MKSCTCVSMGLRYRLWIASSGWLESAATYAERFNAQMLKGFVICELQADEIRTFIGAKKRVIWIMTTLEV